MGSDAVQYAVLLQSTPLYPTTAIQSQICPSSHTELATKGGKIVIWLLSIEGVLSFDVFSVSWRSKLCGEVILDIFRAPACFTFQ